MSYCRWSSNNWRCDLYVYGVGSDEDGVETFAIEVAGNRIKGEVPICDNTLILDKSEESHAKWTEQYKKQMDFLNNAEREPIDSVLAGASFTEYGYEDVIRQLLYLRSAGFSFPDSALERLRTEYLEDWLTFA